METPPYANGARSILPLKAKKVPQKWGEQTENVYENKGPARKTHPQSGNVIENEGT